MQKINGNTAQYRYAKTDHGNPLDINRASLSSSAKLMKAQCLGAEKPNARQEERTRNMPGKRDRVES